MADLVFFCTSCGHESGKWLGQCPGCGDWNTLVEDVEVSAAVDVPVAASSRPGPTRIGEVGTEHGDPVTTAIGELDRMARRLQGETLAALNARALVLQDRDDGDPAATGRFRCGAYVYSEHGSVPKEDEA